MGKSSRGSRIAASLAALGILCVIASIDGTVELKCVRYGCDNKREPNSSYCYLHDPHNKKNSSQNNSSDSNKPTTESENRSINTKTTETPKTAKKRSVGTGNTKKRSSYDSYDDGYDDIYMDGEYDYDRYDSDSDYADGVDDAMDESGEDW